MKQFDFCAPADVFIGCWRDGKRRHITYSRFQRGADAIKHVMESQEAKMLAGTIVETDDVRLGPAEIRMAYDSADYPLPRRKSN